MKQHRELHPVMDENEADPFTVWAQNKYVSFQAAPGLCLPMDVLY